MAGIDPWPLSLAELWAAYEMRRDHEWDQAASIIANLGAALTGKQLHPAMFHPYREHRAQIDDPAKEYARLTGQ